MKIELEPGLVPLIEVTLKNNKWLEQSVEECVLNSVRQRVERLAEMHL